MQAEHWWHRLQLAVEFDRARPICALMDHLLTLLVVEVDVSAISSAAASGAVLGHCLLLGGPEWCCAAGAHELP